ncbi:hypothetical protein KAR91_08200 [Candidatus Pacearchaeota archaeon]|nr:hypothetical protein [Candidatus Pacearchaeota archaeon]
MRVIKFPGRKIWHIANKEEIIIPELTLCGLGFSADETGLKNKQGLSLQEAEKLLLCKNCRKKYAYKYL